MKKIPFCLVAALAAALTGCVAISVYPFYTEEDAAFEPALLGIWTNTTAPDQIWQFERAGQSAYRLTCTDDGKPSVMQAQPFKLRGELFLDLSRTNSSEEPFPPGIPSHVLLRVFQTTPTARLATLKYDWLKEMLEKDPKALRHHVVDPGKKSEDRYFALTADTDELQRFVIKHLKTEAAWADKFDLKLKAPASQPR